MALSYYQVKNQSRPDIIAADLFNSYVKFERWAAIVLGIRHSLAS
jgi:hypothetical protein